MNMNLRVVPGRRATSGDPTNGSARPETFGGLRRIGSKAARRIATRRAHVAAEDAMDPHWFWRRVKLDVERARRTERPFTMLSIPRSAPTEVGDLAERLFPQLRDTDAILAHTKGVLILLGDTSGDNARAAVHRLARASDGLITAADVEMVGFPRDALTFGALVDELIGSDARKRLSIAG